MLRLDAATHRPLVFDGAWDPNRPYFAELVANWESGQELPAHLVRRCHQDFADAGADVLQTFTWDLPDDLAQRVAYINRSANIAREVADSVTGRRCWVAGIVHQPFGEGDTRELATALVRGGVDMLVLALHMKKAEALAALQATQEVCAAAPLPIVVSFDLGPTGKLIWGDDLAETLSACEAMGAYSSGVYLCTSPERLPEPVFQSNGRHAFADAGYTGSDGCGSWTWSMDARTYGEYVAEQATRLQLRFCGGGWGVTPEHIRELVRRLATMGGP